MGHGNEYKRTQTRPECLEDFSYTSGLPALFFLDAIVEMKRPSNWLFPLTVLLGISASLNGTSQATAAEKAERLAFFENHVRPLLAKHCFDCHNAEKQEGGLRLDVRENLLRGGDSGPSLVIGKPEQSLLIEAVRHEGLEMPPEKPLADEDIAKLVRWIRDGANWPDDQVASKPSLGDQEAIRSAADQHWAFRPIEKPPMPMVSDPDWGSQPIDRLILAKLDENQLRPSAQTNRPTLIRRAFHDLIGLPPTPAVIDAVFGQSNLRGMNYRQIIDGLLASQHYGERMARHWMDVARYADTRDFLAAADLRYPFAFTYRDWLIHAFNEDLRFDDFVRLQLAADHLTDQPDDPNLAALGFLSVGPLFRNNVPERVADRIDVVTRGLMGMTGSCARCHDHKYDPISIEDYYSLYGIFRDSQRPDTLPTIESPLGNEVPEALANDFSIKLQTEKDKLAAYEAELANTAMKAFAENASDYLIGYVELNIDKTETTRGLKTKRKLEETALTPIARNLDAFRREAANRDHPILGPIADLIAVPDQSFQGRRTKYIRTHPNLYPTIREAVEQSSTRMELAERIGAVLEAAATEPDGSPVGEFVVAQTSGPFFITPQAASQASRLLGKGRQALLKFQRAIADVEATHPGAPDKAMVVRDAEKLAPTFVMFRGEPSRRGPKVERRFLSYFAGDNAPFENGSGRLELAEHIVSPDNPLTARVIVNRVWRMHFGQGLVDDAGDFGLRSDAPVQGPVLDFLAASLMEHDWSIKWLHRTIMMSKTYRQSSSAMTPPVRDDGIGADEIDSTNRLLWRQNRRRLDFESMRDSMLAVAGTVDLKIGGRSVELSQTPHPVRRTLYAYVDRVDPNPLFATFDVPSPDVSSAQRTETLVPQQALFAMNNPFVTEQARAMTGSSEFLAAVDDESRIQALFQMSHQRAPRPNEMAMLKRFVNEAETLTPQTGPIWSYGFGPVKTESDEDDGFVSLSHFDGKRYTYEPKFPSPDKGFVMLSKTGGHPGKSSKTCSILRFTAPEAMTVRIAGTLQRSSDRGDGIAAQVRLGNAVVFATTTQDDEPIKTVAGYHQVDAGEHVDFVVDPIKTSTSDGYRWTVLVEKRSDDRKDILHSWHSARDFGGPPPPAMTPWEQTAQALLMTNEFLFVD